MNARALGRTGPEVFPVCLGGNVFGWTADEPQSRAVLDAYLEAGGNFIDTANSYLVEHGRSETIIGRWLADRGVGDRVTIATKVGGGRGATRNLRAETIAGEARASLERLQVERIDLYYAHHDDLQTPLEESLEAFDRLVKEGLVAHLGASNYSPERLQQALEIQRRRGWAQFTVLQPHYNLLERDFELTLAPVAARWDLATLPYYALASGFLTGKYRVGSQGTDGDGSDPRASPRARAARAYLRGRGPEVLEALRQVAEARGASMAAVAIAWLLSRPLVVAPIASARNEEQLAQVLEGARLRLAPEELDRLTAAGV